MSRSNPTMDSTPHPCQRWHEWDGENGVPRYYDKTTKSQIVFPKAEFTFILLDQLAVIKGWHEKSESGISSNEVRDVGKDVMTVKAFKGGTLAQGLYSQIKDRVKAQGGHFTANLYIAFKNGGDALSLGAMQFKGAALNAWVEFSKANRAELYTKAVMIDGAEKKKTGKVEYYVPKFKLIPLSEKSNTEAVKVDQALQAYLTSYFARKSTQQVNTPAATATEPPQDDAPWPTDENVPTEADEAF